MAAPPVTFELSELQNEDPLGIVATEAAVYLLTRTPNELRGGRIRVIDPTTALATTTIEVADNGAGLVSDIVIAPGGDHLYVPYRSAGGGGAIDVIDTRAPTDVRTIPVTTQADIMVTGRAALAPDARTLYVLCEPHATTPWLLCAVDLTTGSTTWTANAADDFTPGIAGIAVSPDGQHVYVQGTDLGTQAYRYDTATATRDVVELGAGGGKILFGPDGLARVLDGSVFVVATYDPASGAVTGLGASDGLITPADMAMNPDGTHLVIPEPRMEGGSSILVVDLVSGTVTDRPVDWQGHRARIAAVAPGNRTWIGLTGTGAAGNALASIDSLF